MPGPTKEEQMSNQKAGVALWIVQGLLAALFLFAGGFKLVATSEQMSGPIALPLGFLRFIGLCEVAGALGLVLPGLFRIRPALTPLAATGLVIIMIGATTLTVAGLGASQAVVPFVAGCLAASVAYARWRFVPLAGARLTT
jgi:hypothetical protein